jgi:hypothetical protein
MPSSMTSRAESSLCPDHTTPPSSCGRPGEVAHCVVPGSVRALVEQRPGLQLACHLVHEPRHRDAVRDQRPTGREVSVRRSDGVGDGQFSCSAALSRKRGNRGRRRSITLLTRSVRALAPKSVGALAKAVEDSKGFLKGKFFSPTTTICIYTQQ